MHAAPEVAQPQHMQALNLANRVRLARAAIKRRVGEGEISVADVLFEMPDVVKTMTVFDLLLSQHQWGRTRATRFMRSLRLPEHKTIESLTERQHNVLIQRLDDTSFENGHGVIPVRRQVDENSLLAVSHEKQAA